MRDNPMSGRQRMRRGSWCDSCVRNRPMGVNGTGPWARLARVQSAGLGCEWLAAEIVSGHASRRIFRRDNDLAQSRGPNAAVLQGCHIILITKGRKFKSCPRNQEISVPTSTYEARPVRASAFLGHVARLWPTSGPCTVGGDRRRTDLDLLSSRRSDRCHQKKALAFTWLAAELSGLR